MLTFLGAILTAHLWADSSRQNEIACPKIVGATQFQAFNRIVETNQWGLNVIVRSLQEELPHLKIGNDPRSRYFAIAKVDSLEHELVRFNYPVNTEVMLVQVNLRVLLYDVQLQKIVVRELFTAYAAKQDLQSQGTLELLKVAFQNCVLLATQKISQTFPLTGKVKLVEPRTIVVGFGQNQGIKEGTVLEIVDSQEKNWGNARVIEVQSEECTALMQGKSQGIRIGFLARPYKKPDAKGVAVDNKLEVMSAAVKLEAGENIIKPRYTPFIPNPIKELKITHPTSELKLYMGVKAGPIPLEAKGYDEWGDETPIARDKIQWKVTRGNLDLVPPGSSRFFPEQPGSFQIKAFYQVPGQAKIESAPVDINIIRLEKLELSPKNVVLSPSQTYQFSVSAEDSSNSKLAMIDLQGQLEWEVVPANNQIGKISNNGMLTTLGKAGKCQLKVAVKSAGQIEDTASIVVLPKISLEILTNKGKPAPEKASICPGELLTLYWKITSEDAAVANEEIPIVCQLEKPEYGDVTWDDKKRVLFFRAGEKTTKIPFKLTVGVPGLSENFSRKDAMSSVWIEIQGTPAPLTATVQNLQFFEGDSAPQKQEKRQYDVRFPLSTTRYVHYEIALKNLLNKENQCKLLARCFKPDGNLLGEVEIACSLPAQANDVVLGKGLGFEVPGKWAVGAYQVDILSGNRKLGEGEFTIADDTGEWKVVSDPDFGVSYKVLSAWQATNNKDPNAALPYMYCSYAKDSSSWIVFNFYQTRTNSLSDLITRHEYNALSPWFTYRQPSSKAYTLGGLEGKLVQYELTDKQENNKHYAEAFYALHNGTMYCIAFFGEAKKQTTYELPFRSAMHSFKLKSLADKTPMFGGNLARTRVYPGKGVSAFKTCKWKFKTKQDIYSTPAIAHGMIYVGSWDNYLYAVDVESGQEKWKFQTQGKIGGSAAIEDGIIYIGSDDSYLYALNHENGKCKWKFKTGDCIISSPAVSVGHVYFGSSDGGIYALDKDSGQLIWKFATPGWAIVPSPTIADGKVYCGSDDTFFYALSQETGEVKWKFKTGGGVRSSPAVKNSIVYFGSNDCYFYAMDANTGKEKWKFKTGGGVISSPAVADEMVCFGSEDAFLYAVDINTGKEKWKFKTGDKIYSSPAIADGLVYCGSDDGHLYVVNQKNGTLQWKFKTGKNIISAPLIADGVVYCSSGDSFLYALIGTEEKADEATIEIENLQFFAVEDAIPEFSKRHYALCFAKNTTPSVYCQLSVKNLLWKAKENHADIVIRYSHMSAGLFAEWESLHPIPQDWERAELTTGWRLPVSWSTGVYTVEIFLGSQKVGKKYFTIYDESENAAPTVEFMAIGFYEKGAAAVEEAQRKYTLHFLQNNTRWVTFQTRVKNLLWKVRENVVHLALKCYGPDGTLLHEFEDNWQIPVDWDYSRWETGYGSETPGTWATGMYRVEVYLGGKKTGQGYFLVYNDKGEPAPTVEIGPLHFFEGEFALPEKFEPQYATTFSTSTTRYIYTTANCKNLCYKAKENAFNAVFRYYKPDGSLLGELEGNYVIPVDWESADCDKGFGDEKTGTWPAGSYRVELLIAGQKKPKGNLPLSQILPRTTTNHRLLPKTKETRRRPTNP